MAPEVRDIYLSIMRWGLVPRVTYDGNILRVCFINPDPDLYPELYKIDPKYPLAGLADDPCPQYRIYTLEPQ